MDGTEHGTATGRDGAPGTEHVPSARVTVAEAAAILGVTVVTIRRMIKRGQLEAERVVRPQGSAYLVTLPVDGTAHETSTERPAQNVSRPQGTPAELMAAWSETFLGPIMARMAEQEAALRTLERENGRQAAELAQLRAELDTLQAPQEPQNGTLEPPTAAQPPDPITEPSTSPGAPGASVVGMSWWKRVLLAVYG